MPHRLLVVGTGSIGERHVRCFSATRRADIRIVETNPELRATIADRYQLAASYPDLASAWKDSTWKPDAVLIATPAHLHIPMALEAARQGVALLIEKPLSTSFAGIDELIAEVEARKTPSAVLYTYRSHPLVRSMRAAIASGRFGRPVTVISTWGQHFPKYRPAYRSTYYTRHESGGGAIQDVLTHAVNAAEFLVGPIRQVMADAAHQVLEGVEVEDTVHVIARHEGNVMACYSLNQHQAPNENAITVVCTKGTARFELNKSRWLSMSEPGDEWTVEETFSLERDDIFIQQAQYYLDMLEGKAPSLCTIPEALQTLKVNLAILGASREPSWRAV